MRVWALAAVFLAVGSAFAFQPAPKASAKALGVTRGRAFSAGAVFVNGKYLDPPYVVERWGTCIRINGVPVTGQVVDWNDFLKTQPGVKTVKAEPEKQSEADSAASSSAEAPVAEPTSAAPVAVSVTEAASSLDDLFDDDPKPASPKASGRTTSAASTKSVPRPVVAPRSRATVSYVLDGEFVPNEASKALLGRVNAVRTEVDRAVRSGGFVCFGDSYSRVVGDARTLTSLLDALPELQQQSADLNSFLAGARSAKLVYLNEVLCEELYRNRTDYRKLKERRTRLKRSQKWDTVLQGVGDPLF